MAVPGDLQHLSTIDHLVYATPDLNRGIEEIERRTGIRASPGGQHPGWGTRNALLALGPARYLEIIGPDPNQPTPSKGRPFGIDELDHPRLVTWAAKSDQLDQLRQQAARVGAQLGDVLNGKRQRPDGTVLSWRLTDPWTVVADGIFPFFIDWGTSPHPAELAAEGLSLLDLGGEHPDAERVERLLHQLRLDLPVRRGPKPYLVAIVQGPTGRVELS
jgi:hypothetical protein